MIAQLIWVIFRWKTGKQPACHRPLPLSGLPTAYCNRI